MNAYIDTVAPFLVIFAARDGWKWHLQSSAGWMGAIKLWDENNFWKLQIWEMHIGELKQNWKKMKLANCCSLPCCIGVVVVRNGLFGGLGDGCGLSKTWVETQPIETQELKQTWKQEKLTNWYSLSVFHMQTEEVGGCLFVVHELEVVVHMLHEWEKEQKQPELVSYRQIFMLSLL